MAMGKRKRERQAAMWVATTDFPTAPSHPFYTRLKPADRTSGNNTNQQILLIS